MEMVIYTFQNTACIQHSLDQYKTPLEHYFFSRKQYKEPRENPNGKYFHLKGTTRRKSQDNIFIEHDFQNPSLGKVYLYKKNQPTKFHNVTFQKI